MKVRLHDQASAKVSVEAPRNSSSLTSNIWNGRRYRIWFSLAVWLVFFWSLIELPVELWVSTTWREAVALSYPAGILSRCYNFADVGQRRISVHWVPRMAGCTGLVLVAHPDLLHSGA